MDERSGPDAVLEETGAGRMKGFFQREKIEASWIRIHEASYVDCFGMILIGRHHNFSDVQNLFNECYVR